MNIELFKTYQNEVQRTRSFNDTELINYTLGLVCESGEFGDMIKKHIFHNHDLNIEEVKKELGDVMWYLSNLCNVLDIELSDVAGMNIDKLKKRYPDGFCTRDSVNRSE